MKIEADGASTHAWTEVYLPGAGWKGFDPTSGILTGSQHVTVAMARNPENAAPIAGSFTGPTSAFQNIQVDVSVVQMDKPVNFILSRKQLQSASNSTIAQPQQMARANRFRRHSRRPGDLPGFGRKRAVHHSYCGRTKSCELQRDDVLCFSPMSRRPAKSLTYRCDL